VGSKATTKSNAIGFTAIRKANREEGMEAHNKAQ
jgi:hypothetical protein